MERRSFNYSCVHDWKWLIQQTYKHLRPGGYFEAAEFPIWAWSDDGTLRDDSPYMEYLRYLNEAGDRSGRPMNIASELKDWMEEAGFEDVVQKVYFTPLGPWPKDPILKELGKWEYVQCQDAVEAYGLRLYTQVLGWGSDEAKIHQALVKEQLRDRSLHAYGKM
jgi:hypothetical protein